MSHTMTVRAKRDALRLRIGICATIALCERVYSVVHLDEIRELLSEALTKI